MDVLIIERDNLVRSMLADTLAVAGISATVLADEEALRLPLDQSPRLVITGLNRTNYEDDLTGLMLVSVLRRKWPRMRAIYLAALCPACLSRQALTARERFLRKPIGLGTIIDTVRELLRPRQKAERLDIKSAYPAFLDACNRTNQITKGKYHVS
jgi:DNA-binding response OmpR family regulator